MSDKTVMERLTIKEGDTVRFVNVPPGYEAVLGPLPPGAVVYKGGSRPADVILVFVASRQELEEQLPRLKEALADKGKLWVAYHKGTSSVKTDINRDTMRAYAQTLGLEAVAIISIDEDWSALRLKAVGCRVIGDCRLESADFGGNSG